MHVHLKFEIAKYFLISCIQIYVLVALVIIFYLLLNYYYYNYLLLILSTVFSAMHQSFREINFEVRVLHALRGFITINV